MPLKPSCHSERVTRIPSNIVVTVRESLDVNLGYNLPLHRIQDFEHLLCFDHPTDDDTQILRPIELLVVFLYLRTTQKGETFSVIAIFTMAVQKVSNLFYYGKTNQARLVSSGGEV